MAAAAVGTFDFRSGAALDAQPTAEIRAELEAAGVIRRSESPWCSPLVVVRRNGKTRCCLDLREEGLPFFAL